MSGEITHPVKGGRVSVGLTDLPQIGPHYFVPVTFHHSRHLHPRGINIRTESLGTLLTQTIIEDVIPETVPPDEVELQVEIIIETV